MLRRIAQELAQLRSHGALKSFDHALPLPDGKVRIDGRDYLDLTSTDFLGLSGHPALLAAVHQGVDAPGGLGSGGARLTTGTRSEHVALERRIARLVGAPAALVFSSKNQAVMSLVTLVTQENDIIYCDERCQSPVSDAAYLVGAHVVPFDGQRPETLERECEKQRAAAGEKFVFMESISAAAGDVLPVEQLSPLLLRFGLNLCLDESFGLGLLGVRGEGLASRFSPFPAAVFGALGHATAGFGAFVAGSEELVAYLVSRSKTFQVEGALPPYVMHACAEALDLCEVAHQRRLMLGALVQHVRSGLAQLGITTPPSPSPIIAIGFERARFARGLVSSLAQRGFLVDMIVDSRTLSARGAVRISITTNHTSADLDRLVRALHELNVKEVASA